MTDLDSNYTWWTSLKHGGLLITPARLEQFFPQELAPLSQYIVERLRRDITRHHSTNGRSLGLLLDTVLEDVLGLDRQLWFKGSNIDRTWSHTAITGETLRPRRLWIDGHSNTLPVFVDQDVTRIGVGRGRRSASRVVEWLRKAEQKLALLTNGDQWRLIHAGSDYDAWAEWDTEFWFLEGRPGPQVTALRILLGKEAISGDSSEATPRLLEAIQTSRQGQADLSATLGERVRQAVELLIRESAVAIADVRGRTNFSNNDLYIAANRMIMRCVITLFAEARDLLPRDNPIYHDSYGIQGLREQLDRRAGGRADRLRHSYGAWPRLLGLFQLIHAGSMHEQLPIPAYGGHLFAPGDLHSQDPIRRALLAFERLAHCPSDAAVYRLLELLTRSKIKVRQGSRNTWVDAPVDFSDLSTEYIGILYQGLLDFELRQAATDEPMIFLNLGNQPVLPLTRLENMEDDALTSLVENLKKKSKPSGANGEEDVSEDEEAEEIDEDGEDEDGETDDEELPEDEDEVDDETTADLIRTIRERATAWAERAIQVGGLVTKPRSHSEEALLQYNAEVSTYASKLISRVILPGEWFLVRWGGTRKGSGTFYTRPQLGVPLARRTLQPLAYVETQGEWTPRLPEEILALKVCDSAMGSGSLLIASLRYFTEALFESLYYHGRIAAHGDGGICRLADGQLTNELLEESLPMPPDDEAFEPKLRARLKRYVVERCIYGVDLNPLAVELARLSLWIETMDPQLPFEFLDHKLKCGNGLVGCWLDNFQDYPVMAWEREGGDQNHDRFVHHFREYTWRGEQRTKGDKWTAAIKEMRNDVIKQQMPVWIQQLGTRMMTFGEARASAVELHKTTLHAFEQMHRLALTDPGRQAEVYQEQVLGNPDYQELKHAFDTWCAIWFWPGDLLELVPTPLNFQALPEESRHVVEQLVEEQRFFHWELEFPDVFNPERSGFDAMIKNPPWDIMKPKSQEFFSNIDPLYRTYTKQDALSRQEELFSQYPQIELDWLQYNARFRALSNWSKYAGAPFGEDQDNGYSFTRSRTDNGRLNKMWSSERKQRQGFADDRHPFRFQGSADLNTYKMFLEQSYALTRAAGQLGLIVPSGLSSDKGTSDLRSLFLDEAHWRWLFGFENKRGIFDIHRSFKFYATILQKGGETDAIRAAFMRHDLEDWEEAEKHTLDYPRERIHRFSPRSTAILEIRSQRGLEVLEKMYANGVLLGDKSEQGWRIEYAREFDMTNDSKLFTPRPSWERKGYVGDEYGHWLKGKWHSFSGDLHILARDTGIVLSADGMQAIAIEDVEDIALPLYQGVMIRHFDFSAAAYVSGAGQRAKWDTLDWNNKCLRPQFLMAQDTFLEYGKLNGSIRWGFRDISNPTNQRTFISAIIPPFPSGNKVPIFSIPNGISDLLFLEATCNSFVFDYLLRTRFNTSGGGGSLNPFILNELTLPHRNDVGITVQMVALISASLSLISNVFAGVWNKLPGTSKSHYRQNQAVSPSRRLQLQVILDAIIAYLFRLEYGDFIWILKDCDYPKEVIISSGFSRNLDQKGFWRVDKNEDPELRHTVLSLIAFIDLQEKGLEAFLSQNDGEGWMIPDTVRLADYGLGHDDRANQHQPVASRLGPRFLPWQLEGSSEESWTECERHAENLRLLIGDLVKEERVETAVSNKDSTPNYKPTKDLLGEPIQRDLFGNIVESKKRRK